MKSWLEKNIKDDTTKLQRKFTGIFVKRTGKKNTRRTQHAPEEAVENKEIKVLRDINIQCGNLKEARRPDLIVIDKKNKRR